MKGGTYVPIMRQRRYGDQSGMADEGDDGGEACDGTEKDVTDRRAISADAARALRGDLKGALTGFANGRGSVEALLHEIERIAKYVTGCPDIALGPATEAMRRLVRSDAPARLADTGLPGVEWDDLYRCVLRGRNDIAHTGTEAALTGTRVAALATVLLGALVELAKENDMGTMKDVMVSNPMCAHDWQTLADLRRTMLVNDYSALPLRDGGTDEEKWDCVRAEELAVFLARENGRARGCTLKMARCGECGSRMRVYPADAVKEDEPLGQLLGEDEPRLPVVVTRKVGKRREAVGIVTAFDLL